MIRLYKDPKGEKVFVAPIARHTGTSVVDLHDINTLKSRVKELENMLSTMGTVRFSILHYSIHLYAEVDWGLNKSCV